ncbi:MAG: WecB/TagA/CpsF family glycosyltransferase [Deltaproteobacteria bacterium]|nr:WecB/TagA/CpsF family glycosyltransferase [Deltaproteobacteria bacterium]
MASASKSGPDQIGRLKILDIWVDPVGREGALRRVKGFLQGDGGSRVIFASNPEKAFSVPRNPDLYDTFRSADLLIPDGIGMVLAARILHGVRLERVPGVELMEEICSLCASNGSGIFVYGSREEVNKRAVDRLRGAHPDLRVSGRSHGYVQEPEMPALIDKINASRAEVLFVGLGSPKQEKWIMRYKDTLNHVKLIQGIGGTLDTIAGTVKRAPRAWRKVHLEWLYRLLNEPRRIKRQRVIPIFVYLLLKERLGKSI